MMVYFDFSFYPYPPKKTPPESSSGGGPTIPVLTSRGFEKKP
jgi:hypothetical protein